MGKSWGFLFFEIRFEYNMRIVVLIDLSGDGMSFMLLVDLTFYHSELMISPTCMYPYYGGIARIFFFVHIFETEYACFWN